MVWVDPSHRAVEVATAEEIAAQAVRPKLSVIRVDNGDGTFSYYQQIYLANPTAIAGPIDVTIGGVAPQVDTVNGEAVPTYKLRLGAAGVDDRLVDGANPVPTRNDELAALMRRNNELLEFLLEALTD